MKFRVLASCCLAALLPQLALAANPPMPTGAWQAIYDFCNKLDPKEQEDFNKEAKNLFAGLTPQQIATLRENGDYKRGYQVLVAVMSQLTHTDAVKACQNLAHEHTSRHGWVKREDKDDKDQRRR
jgi:hypothetical protein